MARIERPWIRRIGEYVPGEVPRPARRRAPDEEGEPGPAPDGEEENDGESALDPDAEGTPSETDDERPPDGEAEGAGEGEPMEGEAPEGEPQAADGQGDRPGEGAPPPSEDAETSGEDAPRDELPEDLDTNLSVPEEIEEARREAEREGKTPWNRHHAPKAFPLEGRYLRGLATRFARMVAKLAEDHADMPADGDDEWDLNALLRRRFTGRLPHQCRMSREKRKVVVVLDTSPSCAHQARMFGAIAQIAEELGDCEMYDAPNFQLLSRWERDAWRDLPAEERGWHFRDRVVLAFGDFDGIEHICEASRRRGNRIYWFSCEERAPVLEMQRETFVHEYKGHYFPATQLNALMRQMARVR